MAAAIQYKVGYPSAAKPLETSAVVHEDGLVTGSALFLVQATSSTQVLRELEQDRAYPINTAISPALFSSLKHVSLQGLFVESRSIEKRSGLLFLRINVVGALNPPVLRTFRDVSPRSISKSINLEERAEVFSFDYHGETYTVTAYLAEGAKTVIEVPTPSVLSIWNKRGSGIIFSQQEQGELDAADVVTNASLATYGKIIVRPRILTNETKEQRSGIHKITKTSQFVYE